MNVKKNPTIEVFTLLTKELTYLLNVSMLVSKPPREKTFLPIFMTSQSSTKDSVGYRGTLEVRLESVMYRSNQWSTLWLIDSFKSSKFRRNQNLDFGADCYRHK